MKGGLVEAQWALDSKMRSPVPWRPGTETIGGFRWPREGATGQGSRNKHLLGSIRKVSKTSSESPDSSSVNISKELRLELHRALNWSSVN